MFKYYDTKLLVVFLLEEDDDEKEIHEKAAPFGGIVQTLDGKYNLSYFLKIMGLGKLRKIYNLNLLPNHVSVSIDVYSLWNLQIKTE